jgi:tRNA(Ile)-lysidine synthetase-like protein
MIFLFESRALKKLINILGNIPNKITVACSGGPDSMAILSFLSSHGRRDVSVAYFNHGTAFGKDAEAFIRGYCSKHELPLTVGMIGTIDRGDKSTEEHWRDERANFLEGIDGPVITGHNLNDVMEWYLFSTLHGQSKLIPYQRNNIIRPFLTTNKRTLESWCNRHSVPYIVDPGNRDEKYMRSIIRHKILPEALRVNPGLEKVIKRKIEKRNV